MGNSRQGCTVSEPCRGRFLSQHMLYEVSYGQEGFPGTWENHTVVMVNASVLNLCFPRNLTGWLTALLDVSGSEFKYAVDVCANVAGAD